MDFDGLVTRFQQQLKSHRNKPNQQTELIPWNWVCSNLISLLEKYVSGATEAIILSELQNLWDCTPEDWNETAETRVTGLHAIGETQAGGVLEAKVVATRCIGDTHVWAITLQDPSGSQLDHYLHPHLSPLVDSPCPLLIPGRSVRLVGACSGTFGSPPRRVLLPTPYLSVMLGSVNGVFDDHLTDPFETLPLKDLCQFRGTSSACVIAATVNAIHNNGIYLTDHSLMHPNYVVLQLPHAHRQLCQLVRKGEILRISPHVSSTFDAQNPPVIEYIPGSLICVLGTNTGDISARVESLNELSTRDMRYSKTRMYIKDMTPCMSGINMILRVVSKGHCKPSGKLNRWPLQLCDVVGSGFLPQTLDVTADNALQLRVLRPGMLIYAENLYSTEPKENDPTDGRYFVLAARKHSTKLRPISSLPAILSSSLFPITLLSSIIPLTHSNTPYIHQPTNFVVRATIVEFNVSSLPIIYTAHSRCMKVVNTNNEDKSNIWKCSFCNTSAHSFAKGEWEKVIVMQWTINDGSGHCKVHASPRVHEVILQTRASTFAELDPVEQQAKLAAACCSTYLFSIALSFEGKGKVLRIDQLVPPNPVIETQNLVDNLNSFTW